MSLPISFASNSPERMIQFLNESNRIEGIYEIDYHDTVFQKIDKGHFGALVDSQQLAVEQKPLTIRKIKEWQALLTREQKLFGHDIEEKEIGHIRSHSLPKNVRVGSHIPPDYSDVPILLDFLVERINEGLKDQEALKDDAKYCEFLGRSFQEYESIHPFADGNGRSGRLIANYIATYCKRPIIVFDSEYSEKNRYYEAHKTGEKMAQFMAKKVQDTIFGSKGDILFRKSGNENGKIIYQSLDKEVTEVCSRDALEALLLSEKDGKEEIGV
jgi:Fic family protein